MNASTLERAVGFVTARLESGEWPGGEALPTLNNLALMADVSRGTMWKVIGLLKAKGLLSTRMGGRIVAGDEAGVANRRAFSGTSHTLEAKRIRMEQDLLRGAFAPNKPLPTVNELQGRYGASYRTMRKILNVLTAEGLLTASNKKFYLPRTANRLFRDSVCLLWEGDTFALKPRSIREARFVESLQNECSHVDCSLIFLSFDLFAPSLTSTIRERLRKLESASGFIVRLISLWDVAAQDRYVELLTELSLKQKPIAVLDEFGTFCMPPSLAANRAIKVFTIGAATAGQSVARALLSRGHTKAAYLTRFLGEAWSDRRYQGIVSEFAKAGYPKGVTQFAMDSPMNFANELLNPGNLKVATVKQYFSELPSRRATGEFSKQYPFLGPIVRANMGLIKKFRTSVRMLERLPRQNMMAESYEMVVERSILFMQRELFQLFLEHFFEQAAADRSCTAWVGANDDIAIFALNYLRKRKIKVPGEHSIVGFDGDPLGLEHGITSFDFDFPNISRQMLLFINHPSGTTRFTKHNPVELPGFMIYRNTTT